ncbi:MAG: LysE family translocator, partial [Gammaproteobacteria bacterium]|nr:LysE family translocator [Gammaproteobacteria bacterium]
ALNPKTLLFNAAFIPQFVGTADASLARFCLVAAVFLTVLLVGDVLWAAFANSARNVLGRYTNLRNRLTGLLLTAAGIGLALARR